MGDMNLKAFTVITGANESGHLQNIFRMSVDMNLMVGNKTRDTNRTVISVSVIVKNQ